MAGSAASFTRVRASKKGDKSDFYSIRENVAPIFHVVACRADSWLRGLVLRLTPWLDVVRECVALLIVGILIPPK